MMKCRPGFLVPALSWLSFDERILEEADDGAVPLAERLKFLAIFNGNLDEFCTVRLTELRRAIRMGLPAADGSGTTPEEQYKAFCREAERCMARQEKLWSETLLPELAAHGITFLSVREAEDPACQRLFDEVIRPRLTLPAPVPGSTAAGTAPVQNLALAVEFTPLSGTRKRYALLPLPTACPRWYYFKREGGGTAVAALETLTEAALPRLYPGKTVTGVLLFRILRDNDYHFESVEPNALPQTIRTKLNMRGEREVIRIDFSGSAAPALRALLENAFPVAAQNRSMQHFFLDARELDSLLPEGALPGEAYDRPWGPVTPAWYDPARSMFDVIQKEHDLLLSPPCHTFEPLLKLLHEAAEDPAVTAVSQTLYRVAAHSRVLDELCRAARNGKKVTVLLELKARFDEEKNVFWAQKLADAGARVLFGVPHLKVHAKLLLIERAGHGFLHLSTGNYNEDTAKLYVDYGLFTDDAAMVDDARRLFRFFLEGRFPDGFAPSRLTAAPFALRKKILFLIERERLLAQKGRVGRLTARINNLTDPAVIQALHDAARDGVELRLAVRSICSYRPLPGEKITIVRIIDRYLEHGRAIRAYNGGAEEVYLSSADWMPRNFDRRIELLFPLTGDAADEIKALLEFPFLDFEKGRFLSASGKWKKMPHPSEVTSQRAAQAFWSRAAATAGLEPEITLYRPGDEASIAQLAARTKHEITATYEAEGVRLYDFCTTAARLRREQGKPGTFTLLARSGSHVTGALMITEFSHLNALFTDPACRRRGIASKLLLRAVALLKKLPETVRPERLTVYAAPGTTSFYRRFGFTETAAETTESGVRYTPMQYKFNWKQGGSHG